MNRQTLENQFLSQGASPWKTLLLEVHASGEPESFLQDIFGASHVRDTEDRYLHVVEDRGLEIAVDHLDERFWSFHSSGGAAELNAFLKAAVARRIDLDSVWLPSAHLRLIQHDTPPNWLKTDFRGRMILPRSEVQELAVTVRGRAAQQLLDLIASNEEFPHAVSVSQLEFDIADPGFGSVVEAVNRYALFVARGDSFALHQVVVQSVVNRYRGLVEAAERFAISFESMESNDGRDIESGGGQYFGGPIELTFSRPLANINLFLEGLFSSKEPFRLWGIPSDNASEYAEIEAVDLHVGQRIRMEVSTSMIRIFLRKGGCGNTVARLVSNLQHHVDGGITALDPSIQSHLELTRVAA